MSNQLIEVPFHGDSIQAVQDGEGKVWCPVKRICERLGIDQDSQRRKLKEKAWACTVMIAVQIGDQCYEMFCLDRESLPMWLATIEASRVKPEARPLLELYQKEAARVLADYFLRPKEASSPPQVFDLSEAISRAIAQTMQPLARVIAGIVARLERLEQQPAVTDHRLTPFSLPPLSAGEGYAPPLGVRERIWERWPDATERQRRNIVSRIQRRAFREKFSMTRPLNHGPYIIDQKYLTILDQEIDREKSTAKPIGPTLFDCLDSVAVQ